MTNRAQLLVSVRNAEEAQAALAGGADIIDVKEPARGPLGMADLHTIQAIIAAVAGRVPISVALGELVDNPPIHRLPPGITYAKMGLRGVGCNWRALLARQFAGNRRVKPVAVAYADAPDAPCVSDVWHWAVHCRAAALLIDTVNKHSADLFSCGALDLPGQARPPRLKLALAGSLGLDTIPHALELGADIIAVRSAACRNGDRHQPVESERVMQLAGVIADAALPQALSAG